MNARMYYRRSKISIVLVVCERNKMMETKQASSAESHPRYCADCRNYGGMIIEGGKLTMHRFPSSEKHAKVKKIWMKRCALSRADFKFSSYDSTRICGQHFVGGKGPTKRHNLPSIFQSKTYQITFYDPSKDQSDRDNIDESLQDEDNMANEDKMTDDLCDPESHWPEDKFLTLPSETSYLDVSLRMHDCMTEHKDAEFSHFRHQSQQTATFNVDASEQTDVKEYNTTTTQTLSSIPFSVSLQVNKPDIVYEDLRKDNQKLMFYTGIPSSQIFDAIFDEIVDDAALQTGRNLSETGRPRSLRLIDEFLLVLMRVRLGLLLEDLADGFKIATSTCSQIFNRWIDYLDIQLSFLVTWISRDCVNATMPKSFRAKYPKCRVVIDCTEITTKTPSSLQLRSILYSDYKSHMTYKSLVGISPAGVVTFVSDLYAGSVSDKQITNLSGLVDLCEVGDAIMADKGFVISDLTTPKGVELIIPPFKKRNKQFSKLEVRQTQEIANLRIHVERQMERIKSFRILQGIMPITMSSQASKIWKLCVRLTNLQPQLVSR